ncbi:MAG: DUF6036 family nucleotidyltransferase [archaeon]|nr:hypothetical protein [Nanoarchaeota archaeon]
MISEFKKIEKFFKEFDKALSHKVNVYAIGGTVLLYHGLKPATKDIDLVVETKEEFLEVQKALSKIGFVIKIPGQEYEHMNLNQILQRDDFRIDLFEKKVCDKFLLSKNMTKRAKLVISFGNVKVALCANEDVFLFKTMTEREGDLTDCISLAKTGIDWKIILEELKYQIQKSNQNVWITWVGERLDILEERGLVIPIMKEVDHLRKAYFDSKAL